MSSDIEVKKTVVAIQGIPVEAGIPSDGYVLTYVGLDSQWEAQPLPPAPHFDGYGSGINEFTGTGTIATFKSTESILGLNTNVPVKEFTGEIVPNGTTQNLLVSYLIPHGIQNWDVSVLGIDGYNSLNIYKSDLNFLTANQSTGFMLPTGPSPTNIISNGSANSWYPIATTATGYLNIYGNGSTGTYWSINSKVQYLTPFDPSIIIGCQLWLRADMGTTLSSGSVSQWNDQSRIGDINRNMIQTTTINQPVFNLANSNYNNQPTLDFNASNNQFLSSIGNWSPDISSPYTVIIIGNDAGTSGTNQYGWFCPNSSLGPYFYLAEVGYGYSIQDGSSYTFTGIYSSGVPSFVMIEFNNSGTDTFRLNADTPVSTFGLSNNNIGTNGFSLGQLLGGWYLTGSIAEVIVYDNILSNSDRMRLEAYITGRYGIVIGS